MDPNWTCTKAGPVLDPFGSVPDWFKNGPMEGLSDPILRLDPFGSVWDQSHVNIASQ